MPAKHNGTGIPKRKRDDAIALLSHGFSCSEVARQLRIARGTVTGLRDRQLTRIERAQELIHSQWTRVATKSIDRMQDKLDSSEKIPLRILIPLAGVATDKVIALSRGSTLPDLHAHLHQHLHISAEQAKEAAQELIAMRQLPNESA